MKVRPVWRLGGYRVAALAATLAIAAGACGSGAARGALLPPRNPSHSLRLDEHVRTACSGVHDQTALCLDESVAMLNAGRHNEGLGPLLLPRNWTGLTIPEQIFVVTELERTARGLAPDTGLAADWNAAALSGAEAGTDPTSAGAGAPGFLSIWAGGQANPIAAMASWIYDDAEYPDHTSQTINCNAGTSSGCWGHRDAILRDTAATACGLRCAVGAGYSPTGFRVTGPGENRESYAEVFGVEASDNPDPLMFRWSWEQHELPGCERVRDSCGWAGRPLVTANGVINVRGLAQHASLVRPWFSAPIQLVGQRQWRRDRLAGCRREHEQRQRHRDTGGPAGHAAHDQARRQRVRRKRQTDSRALGTGDQLHDTRDRWPHTIDHNHGSRALKPRAVARFHSADQSV